MTAVAARQFLGSSRAMSLTMSIGLSSLRHARPASAEQLVRQADTALRHAKRQGGRRVTAYQPAIDAEQVVIGAPHLRPLRIAQ